MEQRDANSGAAMSDGVMVGVKGGSESVSEICPEIIAVITAAIATMLGSEAGGSNGFTVRKISRIHGEKVSWSNTGLMECIDSRKM